MSLGGSRESALVGLDGRLERNFVSLGGRPRTLAFLDRRLGERLCDRHVLCLFGCLCGQDDSLGLTSHPERLGFCDCCLFLLVGLDLGDGGIGGHLKLRCRQGMV
jgi:hypothetical protein